MIIGVVEVVYRLISLIISIYITMYVLLDNNYTFMQYILAYRQVNGTGYSYESNDMMYIIIIYVTLILHRPIMMIHLILYASPILYKHEYYYLIRKVIIMFVLMLIVHYVTFNLVIPVLIVIFTDVQYNIGQDYVFDIAQYIYVAKYVRLGCYIYVLGASILHIITTVSVSAVSIYRRLCRLCICLIYAASDDISTDVAICMIILVIAITELNILLFILRKRSITIGDVAQW